METHYQVMREQVDPLRVRYRLLEKSQHQQRNKLLQQKLLILHLLQVLVPSKLWLRQLKSQD